MYTSINVWHRDCSGPLIEGCGCHRCYDKRLLMMKTQNIDSEINVYFDPSLGFRYACEICGNKRCPHHSDHRNACTDSNEPGQPGSDY